MAFLLSLVTQERELVTEEVDFVKAKGVDGEFGVLTGHSPFITLLDPGELVVRKGEAVFSYYVSGGVAEVLPGSMVILADTVERAEEIDAKLADQARANAVDALKNPVSESERKSAAFEFRQASVRLSIASRRRSGNHPDPLDGD